MRDVVVISLEVWDEVWRRNQHLVAGLLRAGHVRRVLFVEPPVDVGHSLRGGRLPGRSGLRRIAVEGTDAKVWALRPTKWLPRRIDAGGDRRRAGLVARTAPRLGMTDPVLWVNDPGGAEVLAVTGWPALYDITDDWLVADRPAAELTRLRRQETYLFDHCREVVVCSEGLRRTKSALREVVLIPNAVDLEPYRTLQPRPEDLPTGLVALYLGTAHRDRVDVDLCVATARALSHPPGGRPGTVVLVGPAPLPAPDLAALRAAGVQVLGPRASEQVPAYLQHADVLLVPHVLTDFTMSLDPIKAYEYRAARRQVVATPVAGFVDVDDPLVQAVSAAAFPGAVTAATADVVPWSPDLPDDIPSWTIRVEQMADVLDRVAGGHE
ncbi:glycosyltransferase [Ornithinimicrobium avium]|uniref:Glycosyltransferase n=1 Tax=Ornithinimicrobium avium TaxID=2283195 RepID=A0A345NPC6_9MICO|nr:glycosyltransferase [Ornithinimicrobium avium]AXH96884.1 glycosyltransferase [Ornithinimicrobium avium]